MQKWNEEDTPIGAIKVTFNSMGGSEVNPQYVQKDNTIALYLILQKLDIHWKDGTQV